MKNTNEKANNIIVLQMVFAATENQTRVSVIADYTDVLFCCAVVNNIYFAQMVHKIYPAELQLNKHNSSDTEAPF